MADGPAVAELDTLLASLNELKAPGANRAKIASITTLAAQNIADETQVVQSFYRAVKRAPATHKLGAIYAIDSVIRKWSEKAKQAGHKLPVNVKKTESGSYPAALQRVGELLPALVQDAAQTMPAEQKPKLVNLIAIWSRGEYFPASILESCNAKLADFAGSTPAVSTPTSVAVKFRPQIPTRPVDTPLGWPSNQVQQSAFAPPQAVPSFAPPARVDPAPSNVDSILKALAMAAPANNVPTPQQIRPPSGYGAPPATSTNMSALQAQIAALGGMPQPPASRPQDPRLAAQSHFTSAPPAMPVPPQQMFGNMPAMSMPAWQPPVQQAATPVWQQQNQGWQPPPQPQAQSQPQPQSFGVPDAAQQYRGLLPDNILNDPAKFAQTVKFLQELVSQGLPPSALQSVIAALSQPGGDQMNSRDRNRSRSPARNDAGGRRSPVYGSYSGPNEQDRYRQRDPFPSRDNQYQSQELSGGRKAWNGKPMQIKNTYMDPNLPKDSIKVMSRTLFVGGVTGSKDQLEQLFSRWGKVQSIIASREKQHAFVKMTTRVYAANAHDGMEKLWRDKGDETHGPHAFVRQTKWGVGFGPRDCCNYADGESVIPISRLTVADRKWLLEAEFGGTGGDDIIGGMVVEEPDIEIGAGVSSKAMSRRVGPNSGGPPKEKQYPGRGGRQEQGERQDYGGGRQRMQRVEDESYGDGSVGLTAVPPFSFGLN